MTNEYDHRAIVVIDVSDITNSIAQDCIHLGLCEKDITELFTQATDSIVNDDCYSDCFEPKKLRCLNSNINHVQEVKNTFIKICNALRDKIVNLKLPSLANNELTIYPYLFYKYTHKKLIIRFISNYF